MDKDTFINYIDSLGFNYLQFSGVDTNIETFFFDETMCVVLEKTLDYYTPHYGNHPISYNIKFFYSGKVSSEYTLDTIKPIEIIQSIDTMMDMYCQRAINVGNVYVMDKHLKYEKLKTPVLKSILRDLRIQVILLDKEGNNGVK